MEALFLKILSLSLGATYVAAAVIALRFLLKRTPKWIVCAMWGLVAIRLLCPFTLESAVSLAPSPDFRPVPLISANQPETPGQTPRPAAAQPAQAGAVQAPTESPAQAPTFAPAEAPVESQTPTQRGTALFARVWLLGAAGMLGYLIFSTLRLHRRVGVSIPMAENVRCSESVDTPFVLGVFRPTIYLPASVSPEDVPYVLAHERTHIRRRDHWWKPLGFVLLSVYWFNPVLWLAYVLLCRDIEAACDERVIRDMAAEGRRAYSTALLRCSMSRDAIAACPLAFGETGVKERIRAVASYKKPAFWTILKPRPGDDYHLGSLRGLDLTDVQRVVVQAADLLRHQPGYGERRALAQPGGKIPDGQGSGGDGGVVRFRSAAAKQRRRQSRCQYDFPKLHGAKILSG